MLGNLQGYHVLIVLAVVIVLIAIVIVVASMRRRSPGHGDAVHGDPSHRIEQLERLRDQGVVSEEEFEAKRLEILRQM